ncbi:PAS domain-containing sensor histidine kinase [Chitinimonas arctica]|uniref:PAS domain-containing sensor histidine kinase n=1 Tax=Chitinimonas arctica TaxID=2594795 RepID=UPI001CC73BB0|nr:ATP-binding protein [Chitinimonas arctica]
MELIAPADQQATEHAELALAVERGATIREALRRRKDGSLVYVAVTAKTIANRQGELAFILFSEKDITELKVLRMSKLIESRFGELLESTPDGIIMAGATGRVIIANGQAERMFGYEAGELRGKPIEILLPDRYRAAHINHRSGYFGQPKTRSMGAGLALFGRRKDSLEFPVEISLSPLKTEEGTLVISAIRDISERRHFERVLQEKNIELEAAAEAKDHFLANMSHELRTPLNAIIGFTGTLLMRLAGPLTVDQEKQLQTVSGSAKHLLSLINDLLDLAKIESGKVELSFVPVACAELIAEVAAVLRPLAEKKGVHFVTDVTDETLIVQSDRRALSQIVINLANNAIKFTDSGGRVTVVLRRAQHNGQRATEVSIIDTGCGIRPEDLSSLFQAFAQLDSSSTRHHEGTGLGLHLSQKLAALLGGHISLHSEFGKGSTFVLVLLEQIS